MTNEVKNVPELRFLEFEENWSYKKLKDLLKVHSGRDYKHLEPGEIPVYGTGGYMLGVSDYLSNDDAIGIGRKGTINKPYLLKSPFWTVDTLFYCTPREEVNLYFLLSLFKKINWKKYDESTGVPSLSKVNIEKLKVYSCELEEQRKIGDFFSKLDRQIELEEQKLEKLKEQKKGYMQQIFSQELRFKDESENDYPEWKERKFSELLNYSSNGVDKKINKNHDIAYMVNYMDVFKKTKLNTKNRDLLMEITATKVQKEKNNLKKGDILFTPSSETREDIAKSTVVFEDLDNTVYSYHLIRLRPLDSNIFSLKYSNYLSEQNFISKQFRRLAQGAQRYTLTKEYFENIKLNLPHIKEQEKIGDFFSKLDEVINKQSQKIDELKLRKQGFLQKMFV